MDDLECFMTNPPPTPTRPLLGLTVLIVEDSRYASEAMRMLCLRSGARIRRADSLASARKHLRVYRPTAVIVDMGLPDGSGAELIAELSSVAPRVGVIIATSGDPATEPTALAAGADGFLEKPVVTLTAFQEAILAHLPEENQPPGPRLVNTDEITPDPIALQDDLAHIEDVIAHGADGNTRAYLTQFMSSIAHSANDEPLARKADGLLSGSSKPPSAYDVSALLSSLRTRLDLHAVM
ncbi:response regulator [Halocynthiibacter sp. C4]|uniref:response regulator n=1 Tax=Halocynthiibacter sp. C4 TaxID=2992758 RepID=UPI00237BD05B|nr:response regulator [Halocynthiibacter sp. C4]MDE0590251.1 response regulator [Halocynthiibacter sp. C4]